MEILMICLLKHPMHSGSGFARRKSEGNLTHVIDLLIGPEGPK
jgi:hypothetical protein